MCHEAEYGRTMACSRARTQSLSSPRVLERIALVFRKRRDVCPNEAVPAIVFAASEAAAVLPGERSLINSKRECHREQRSDTRRCNECRSVCKDFP